MFVLFIPFGLARCFVVISLYKVSVNAASNNIFLEQFFICLRVLEKGVFNWEFGLTKRKDHKEI